MPPQENSPRIIGMLRLCGILDGTVFAMVMRDRRPHCLRNDRHAAVNESEGYWMCHKGRASIFGTGTIQTQIEEIPDAASDVERGFVEFARDRGQFEFPDQRVQPRPPHGSRSRLQMLKTVRLQLIAKRQTSSSLDMARRGPARPLQNLKCVQRPLPLSTPHLRHRRALAQHLLWHCEMRGQTVPPATVASPTAQRLRRCPAMINAVAALLRSPPVARPRPRRPLPMETLSAVVCK